MIVMDTATDDAVDDAAYALRGQLESMIEEVETAMMRFGLGSSVMYSSATAAQRRGVSGIAPANADVRIWNDGRPI